MSKRKLGQFFKVGMFLVPDEPCWGKKAGSKSKMSKKAKRRAKKQTGNHPNGVPGWGNRDDWDDPWDDRMRMRERVVRERLMRERLIRDSSWVK